MTARRRMMSSLPGVKARHRVTLLRNRHELQITASKFGVYDIICFPFGKCGIYCHKIEPASRFSKANMHI
jgi:hypothetical protein